MADAPRNAEDLGGPDEAGNRDEADDLDEADNLHEADNPDDFDLDESDDSYEGAMDPPEDGLVLIERLASLGEWELYRLVERDTGRRVASIAIRPPTGIAPHVSYAVWRPEDEEDPGAAGSVERLGREWDDAAREDAIRQVLFRYEDDLEVPQERAAMMLGVEPESNES